MKKCFYILMIIVLISPLYAASMQAVDTRGFVITAQKGSYQSVSVEPISSSAMDSASGMPFYLTDENVQYEAGAGDIASGKRRIANWSFYSNFEHPKITIDAPDLQHADGTRIPYYLSFYYQIDDYGTMRDGNILVKSGEIYNSQDDESCLFNTVSAAINFTERPVRFMLAEGVDITDTKYPYGNYRATVTVTILGGE